MQERIIRGLVEGYGVGCSVSTVTMHSMEICRRNFEGLDAELKMYEVERLGLQTYVGQSSCTNVACGQGTVASHHLQSVTHRIQI